MLGLKISALVAGMLAGADCIDDMGLLRHGEMGDTVLVQGGGVATAAIMLARGAGFRAYSTSRYENKRGKALQIGAHEVFELGARLPVKVDAVIETVGAATWSHSVKSMRTWGTIVIAETTSDDARARLDDGHAR